MVISVGIYSMNVYILLTQIYLFIAAVLAFFNAIKKIKQRKKEKFNNLEKIEETNSQIGENEIQFLGLYIPIKSQLNRTHEMLIAFGFIILIFFYPVLFENIYGISNYFEKKMEIMRIYGTFYWEFHQGGKNIFRILPEIRYISVFG